MTTANGDSIFVSVNILDDESVEGLHTFTVEVEDTDLVAPWTPATVEIIDNDSKCADYKIEKVCNFILFANL